jgi:hypothetical protein
VTGVQTCALPICTSHLIMKKEGVPDLLSIPMKDELKHGIVHTRIRITGLAER